LIFFFYRIYVAMSPQNFKYPAKSLLS
jgi:hypothetical protein